MINPIRRIVYLALASLTLLSLSACKGNNQDGLTDVPTKSIETTMPSPTPTTEVTPTPTIVVTPVPAEFSFENVFNEIFSDQELYKLYPNVLNFEEERLRIYNNISRIEDFDFYELTTEEQVFIKETQNGNIEKDQESQLKGILEKIKENDQYVFDDVDNNIKIQNRADLILRKLVESGHDFERNPISVDLIIEVLKLCNGGDFHEENSKEYRRNFGYRFLINANGWLFLELQNDYEKNKLKGNYQVVPSYLVLFDGSDAEKIIKEYYNEFESKLLKCKNKKSANKIFKEMVNKVMDDLIISAPVESKEPGGRLKEIKSDVHRYIVYCYLYVELLITARTTNINFVYVFPEEYIKFTYLSSSKINIMKLLNYINSLIDSVAMRAKADDEATKMKQKYSESNLTPFK